MFERWYKLSHSCPDLLAEAVYGLPELNRAAIAKARIVANPGCYPTTMQLGFAPLLQAGLVDASHLIADCKSGVSGAGRKAELGTAFSEASDNFKAYGVTGHRHHPETVETPAGAQRRAGRPPVHAASRADDPRHALDAVRAPEAAGARRPMCRRSYEDAYRDEPFVDVLPPGAHPDTRSTRASNMLRIAVHRPDGEGDTVVLLVVQDNLVKGASGQAVQCMNLMFGLPETTGLRQVPVLP